MFTSQHPFRFSRDSLLGLRPSPTLTINDRIRAMMAAGQGIFHLGFGESRFPVHPLLAQALQDNVQRRSYLPALGIPELREAIAQYYTDRLGLAVAAEQVVIGPGSKALLYALMLALDADIVLPTPAWVSYRSQAQLARRPVLPAPMDAAAGYAVDVERIEHAMNAAAHEWRQPDLLLLNTPHNPTGAVMSPETTQAVAAFARERGMMILSDEIYRLVTHDGVARASPAQFYPEGTVVLGGLSKHLSLGGWRFGLAILPPGEAGAQLARALAAIAGSVWSCVAAPVQYAALEAYRGRAEIEAYIAACAAMHAVRTRFLYDALEEFGLDCPQPQGAFYLYPSFARWRGPLARRGVNTCRDLAAHLLENYAIAILPGAAFDDDPQALAVRLSTSYLDAETDEQAHALVAAFADGPAPEAFIQNHHPRLRRLTERLAEFIGELEREL